MADDAELLIEETKFTLKINEDDSFSTVKYSKNILNAKWDFSLELRNHYVEAKVSLKCSNLKRRLLVKGDLFIPSSIYFGRTREQFQNIFEVGDNSFNFVVNNICRLSRKYTYVTCKLQFYGNLEDSFYMKYMHEFLPLRSDLKSCSQLFHKSSRKDLRNLYQEKQFSDVTLRCESEIFKVHKCVLSARSKVFAAMFQNPMKESESDAVEIKDISPDTLQALLKYMYLYEFPKLSDTPPYDLLAAAEMYDLPELKRLCIIGLHSTLSVDNALCTLSFADLYEDKDLKEKSIDYICKKFYHLKDTQVWKTFEIEKPHLANQVLITFNKLVDLYCNKITND